MKVLTPLKAIRSQCFECSGGSTLEIRNCAISDCPLFEFRFGKNPHRKGIGRFKGLDKKNPTQQSSGEQKTYKFKGAEHG